MKLLSRERSAAWALGLVLLVPPVVAHAQNPPAPPSAEPTPPPEEPTVPVPRVGPEFKVPPPAPRWHITLAVLGGYDSNVQFEVVPEEDFGGSFRASVQRRFERRRSRFNVSLGGSAYTYSSQSEEDNVNGTVELSWTRQISSSDTFNMSAYGTYESTATQHLLTDVGIQLPRTQTQGYGGAAGFDFRVGQHGRLKLGGRFGELAYEDPTLVDNQTIDANATLSREIGKLDDLAFSYGFLRNTDQDAHPFQHHSVSLGWRRTLTPNVSLTLTGGLSYSPISEGGLSREFYPQGGLRLNGVWRRTTLSAEARQTVTPAYGLGGDQLADIGTLSAAVPFGRKVTLAISGNVVWGREREDAAAYFSQDATVALNWRLFRYAGLGVGYTFRRTDPEDELVSKGHKVYCGITYTRP
jgi:hypothetical protein